MSKKWPTHAGQVTCIGSNGRVPWGECGLRETPTKWVEDGDDRDEEFDGTCRWPKNPDTEGGTVATVKEPGFGKRMNRARAWELDLASIRPLTRDEIRAPLRERRNEASDSERVARDELTLAEEELHEATRELARFDRAHPRSDDDA